MSPRLLPVLLLAGCDVTFPAPPGDDDDTDTTGDDDTDPTDGTEPFSRAQYDTQSGSDGRFDVFVGVDPGDTALQVTASTAEFVGLEGLYDPDGTQVLDWQDWVASPYGLTNAVFGFEGVTAFDWPIRAIDGTLTPGTWRLEWSITDANYDYLPNEPVTVAVARKRDPDLTSAVIGVQIAWASGVDDDPAVVEAVEGAVERWREVWALYGLTLRESYVPSSLDPQLPFAYDGSAALVPVAAQKRESDLMVVVGESVEGDYTTYGYAGGIPGTLEVTPKTYVVVSWLAHAGPDGVFDDDEIRLLGETMAHETGHYEGLYHPVESGFTAWDALEDTPDCTNRGACESNLGTNLMFPYALCNADSCLPTDVLTPDQQGVVQRYVGAL